MTTGTLSFYLELQAEAKRVRDKEVQSENINILQEMKVKNNSKEEEGILQDNCKQCS